MVWFNGNKKSPSTEAQMAQAAAVQSREQAREDLARSEEKLQECLPVIEALRAHNEENHYDDWLRSLADGVSNDHR